MRQRCLDGCGFSRRAGRRFDRNARCYFSRRLRLRSQSLYRVLEQRNTFQQSADARVQLRVLRQRQIADVQHIAEPKSERYGDNEIDASGEPDQRTDNDADPNWHARRPSDGLVHNNSRPVRGLPSAASNRAIEAGDQPKSIVAHRATPSTTTRYRKQPGQRVTRNRLCMQTAEAGHSVENCTVCCTAGGALARSTRR